MKHFFPRRRLNSAEILLIPEAYYRLAQAWIKVRFLPSKKYLPTFESHPNALKSIDQKQKAQTVATVINGLSTRTFWTSTCLIKAMATHKMLNRRGINHQLHFGVASSNEKLKAHAWVSVEQVILVGGENSMTFTEIKSRN